MASAACAVTLVAMSGDDLFERLLAATKTEPGDRTLALWTEHDAARARSPGSPIDRALLAGASADRIGFAFASGYQAALAAIFGATATSSMLVTEAGGGHPRAIATTVGPDGDGLRVDGEKRFATLGTLADVLYVLAKEGERDGLPALRVVVVPRTSAGIRITAMPETPFCPEIPHAFVAFDGVRVARDACLPGDGYARYVRPFRTVEDLHVYGAVTAFAFATSVRAGLPPEHAEGFLALAVAIRALAALPREAPSTALALEGTLVRVREQLTRLPEALRARDPEAAARLERDAGIVRVAAAARTARAEKARAALG